MEKRNKKIISIIQILISITNIFVIIYSFLSKNSERDLDKFIYDLVCLCVILMSAITPYIIEKIFRVEIHDFLISIFYILVIFAFLFGEVYGYYVNIFWWDSMLHILVSIFLTFFLYNIYIAYKSDFEINTLIMFIFILAISVMLTTVWEIVEFTMDCIFKTNMQRYIDDMSNKPFLGQKALYDTMKDIIINFITSFTSMFILLRLNKKNKIRKSWIIVKK